MTHPHHPSQPADVRLRRLLDRCTVQIRPSGITGGSGFFVAPGLVASCAHVVGTDAGVAAATAEIEWDRKTLTGRVRAVPSQRGSAGIWPNPDLCLIEIDSPPPGHPYAVLGEFRGLDSTQVYLAGFNLVFDRRMPQFQGKNARLDGPQNRGELWQIAGCEVAPGMSGGPILDVRSGFVCAVAKARRKADSAMGGWVIPAPAIQLNFPDLWTRIRAASTQASEWNALRAELQDYDPYYLLNPRERRALIKAAQRLGLRQPDFNELWREIAGDLVVAPAYPLENVLDLASALSELNFPDGELLPLARLFQHLETRQRFVHSTSLHLHGKAVAARHQQADEYESYLVPAQAKGFPPVFVVRLRRCDGRSGTKVQLEIWRYLTSGSPPKLISCNPRRYDTSKLEELDEIETAVTEVLADHMDDLTAIPRIEFVLPDHLLDQPIEKWAMGSKNGDRERQSCEYLPLGEEYPVVIRIHDREGPEENTWRSRDHEFRTGRMPALGSEAWKEHWVCCGDNRGLRGLNSMLRGEGSLPFLAMTAWPGREPVPLAVEVARRAGVPIMVWHHDSCAHANHPGECGRCWFPAHVAECLSGVPFTRLPHEIWQVRLRASSHGETEHPGHRIALLWDDPSRRPWIEAPSLQPPAGAGGKPKHQKGPL